MKTVTAQPVVRTTYRTDPPSAAAPDLPAAADGTARAQVPVALVATLGERIAAGVAALQQGAATAPEVQGELARLERLGLQLQELTHIVTRAQQLRQESVDLGLALLQTVAEWSAEANRLGVELHGPARSVMVQANPAALKHLLDLLVEHALQQGRAVRLDIESVGGAVQLVGWVSSEPVSSCPTRDTLAWTMLKWFCGALGLLPQRLAVKRGERLEVALQPARD